MSVVIPVKDRRELLRRALDGLAAQTFTDFEVIVVDDGSSDGSGELARQRVVLGREVQVLDGGGRGAVAARTLGVDGARGELLAFTDSDCVPTPRWLELAVAAMDAGADLVNGRTVPARPVLPLERSLGSGLEGLYPTCNVVYRREAFDRAGRFDREAARRWGFRPDRRSKGDGFGEDTLLAWRVVRGGGTATYVEEALVEHAVFPPDGKDMLSRTARVAAFPAMIKEIPELRRTLVRWGWQLGHRTRLPTYATLVVLPIALVLGSPLLLSLPVAWWVALRMAELRRFPISRVRRLRILPVEMAIDAHHRGVAGDRERQGPVPDPLISESARPRAVRRLRPRGRASAARCSTPDRHDPVTARTPTASTTLRGVFGSFGMVVEAHGVGLRRALDLEPGGVEHPPVAGGVGVEPLAVAAAAVEAEEGPAPAEDRQPQLDLLGREEHAVGDRAHGLEGPDRVPQVEQQAAAHHDVERADVGRVEVVDAERPPVDLRARQLAGQPEPGALRRAGEARGRGPGRRPGSRAASPRAGGPRRRWRRPRPRPGARARRRGSRRRCRCRGSACPARWARA